MKLNAEFKYSVIMSKHCWERGITITVLGGKVQCNHLHLGAEFTLQEISYIRKRYVEITIWSGQSLPRLKK